MSDYSGYSDYGSGAAKKAGMSPAKIGGILAALLVVGGVAAAAVVLSSGGGGEEKKDLFKTGILIIAVTLSLVYEKDKLVN